MNRRRRKKPRKRKKRRKKRRRERRWKDYGSTNRPTDKASYRVAFRN